MLRFSDGESSGTVHLASGEIVHATAGELEGEDDAGVPFMSTVDPMNLVEACPGGQTCLTGFLADPGTGVCGTEVDRGESCSFDEGRFCMDGDVCAPEDANDPESDFVCHQDCTPRGVICDTGSCRDFRGRFGYCQ